MGFLRRDGDLLPVAAYVESRGREMTLCADKRNFETEGIRLFNGDCLEIMPTLVDKSVDMILCDLPYGTTACKWDTIIPFEPLWNQYKRLIKDNGAIVLTASQPFVTDLINSNREWFRYEWIWDKDKSFGIFLAKIRPLKQHENILVFYKKQPTYNPQMKPCNPDRFRGLSRGNIEGARNNITGHLNCKTAKDYDPSMRYPNSTIKYSNPVGMTGRPPTQKPVALFEYLIHTYTHEGDMVLDNCAGSGTTGVACLNINRKSILIEKDVEYCKIIRKRIQETKEKIKPIWERLN